MGRDERNEGQGHRRRGMSMALRSLVVLVLLAVGVIGGVIWGERRAASRWRGGEAGPATATKGEGATEASGQRGSTPPGAGRTGVSEGTAPVEDPVEVSVAPDAMERAGIRTAEVGSQSAAGVITVPGTVASNAYRETKVNALVGGIVRHVAAELGARVERGQPLAVIFSSELADAQMRYLSTWAMLQADRQRLQRTEKLVELGAASRQELEEATATHAARKIELAAAGQRLLLFGLSPERVTTLDHAAQVVADVTVPAPAGGTVVARALNPGQVVTAGQELFVVADLTSVWVIGDLYEKEFPVVRVGTRASVATASAPNGPRQGRVAYIDPRVEPSTRTAKVRVEVPNRNGDLRLGMFVTVSLETGPDERRTVVPRAAVQTLGERAVVYVAVGGEGGRFTERPVKVGQRLGEFIEVLEGLKAGERVVTEGSFFLRAEAARARSGG